MQKYFFWAFFVELQGVKLKLRYITLKLGSLSCKTHVNGKIAQNEIFAGNAKCLPQYLEILGKNREKATLSLNLYKVHLRIIYPAPQALIVGCKHQ